MSVIPKSDYRVAKLKRNVLPNFLVVGAEKAGTTTLATMLSQHPEIFMCAPKEPMFFSYHNWDKGLDWYASLFKGGDAYKAIGEASPVYTWAPYDNKPPQRIYECLGDIKYIYILRHPIDRMISHYRHALFWQWIPDNTSFEEALRVVPAIKNCSRYFFQIQQYLPYTCREQWHIFTLEELTQDPKTVQQALYNFLEIDNQVVIPLASKNVMDQKRRKPTWFRHLMPLKRIFPSSIYQQRKHIVKFFEKEIKRPNISTDIITALAEEVKPDIQKLGEFYDWDFLSFWGLDA